MEISVYISFAIIIIVAFIFIRIYNNFISKRNEIRNAFGSIDAMLKKRYDLIPNLVETVKAYMKHEENIILEVTRLRTQLYNQPSQKEKLETDFEISKNVKGLLMAVENYPALRASENFIQLQQSWNESEDQIAASRRFYNSAITLYNNAVQSFPSNIVAGFFGFKEETIPIIPDEERLNLNAKELFNN